MVASEVALGSRWRGAAAKPVVVVLVLVEILAVPLAVHPRFGPWLLVCPPLLLGALWLSSRAPLVGASALLVAAFIDQPEIPVGSSHVRIPELVALGFAVAILHRVWVDERGSWGVIRRLRSNPVFLPAIAFLATNLVSVAFSPTKFRSLSLNAIYIALVLAFLALSTLKVGDDERSLLIRVVVVASLLEAAAAVAILILSAETRTLFFGIQHNADTGFLAAKGFLNDANFLGSFLITPLLLLVTTLAVALDRSTHRTRPSWPGGTRGRWIMGLGGSFLISFAILASLTRGAWAALVLGSVALGAYVVTRMPSARGAALAAAAAAVLGFSAAAVVSSASNLAFQGTRITSAGGPGPSITNYGPSPPSGTVPATSSHTEPSATQRVNALLYRVRSVFDLNQGSTHGRIEVAKLALREWVNSPVLGTGAGSFHSRLQGEGNADPPYILNMYVNALHDTGLVGLLVLLWFHAAYFVLLVKALRVARGPDARLELAGLTAGTAALLIAFQFSTGLLLLYPWAIMGLGVALAQSSRTTAAANPAVSPPRLNAAR